MINDLKKSDACSIQLTIAINFIFYKENDKEHGMYSKGNNIESMIYDNADDNIEEPFESLLNRYQFGLETSMRGIDFIFDCVHLLYSKCHKIIMNRGESYIDSPDWIKNKKATKNLINKKIINAFNTL